MRATLPLLTMLAALAACQQSETKGPQAQPSASAAAAAAPKPSASASATPSQARKIEEETELYTFAYSYPAQAGAIPALREWLGREEVKSRSEVATQAREARDESRKSDFPFRAHSLGVGWSVVADLPGWLSLSAEISSYGGGAHGNYGFDALLWDKSAGRRRQASDLFVSPADLNKVIRTDFCREIDKLRAQKRGEPVQPGSGEMFAECIDPLESAVILGSSNKRTFDRIGVLVGPYAAGPYAEGDYEVTLPVTEKVLAAVKPEFRSAFSVKR